MTKIAIFLADGFEEIEALTCVDLLRRASLNIDIISTNNNLSIVGDHGIKIQADKLLEECSENAYDCFITPGGMSGTLALSYNKNLLDILKTAYENNKLICSICASPLVLRKISIPEKHRGCCYPSLADKVGFMKWEDELCVHDKNLITAQGPAASFDFALKIIEILAGKDKMNDVKKACLYDKIQK